MTQYYLLSSNPQSDRVRCNCSTSAVSWAHVEVLLSSIRLFHHMYSMCDSWHCRDLNTRLSTCEITVWNNHLNQVANSRHSTGTYAQDERDAS